MNHRIKSLVNLVMGVIAGVFLGATVGQLLGAIIGALIDMFEFNTINASEILIGGILGLVFGLIIAAGLLSIGKLLFTLSESFTIVIVICAFTGMLAGLWTGFSLPRMIHVINFMVFGSSVGLWVGMSVGFIVGAWLPLRASKNEVILTEEEKSLDKDYASFLGEKARHK